MFGLAVGLCASATAGRLSDELEIQLVSNVGFTPQTVQLANSYTNPIPICTYNLPSQASPTAIPRIGLITSDSFELSIQSIPNIDPGITADVHCIIAEAGTHTLPDGLQFQALTATVTDVLGLNAGGFPAADVDLTASIAPGFSDPIALGAVITSNDARASAFHADDCEQRQNEPFLSNVNDGICVGYHIGQTTDSPPYASETVGVLIVESGTGTVNNVVYEVDRGPTAIDGVGNAGGGVYTVGGDFEVGVATLAGENGGQGGWAVLIGADPLPANQLFLAVEEEVFAGDMSRGHVNETVDYWIFRDDNAPALSLTKTPSATTFAEAGDVIDYDYLVENTGNADISALVVNDDLIASVSCPVTVLSVGATTTCTASYTITAVDVAAGMVTNNAAADGVPTGGSLTPATATATVTIVAGSAALDVVKTVEVFDPASEDLLAVPGNDVLYTITVTNSGTGAVDPDTIFIVDELPAEVVFFNGDVDGPGPETGRVAFSQTGTGLTFDPVTDVAFATGNVRPTDISACTHPASSGFDPAIRFVCLTPRGTLNAAAPDPEFALTFRARLN
ncbi:MAG: hypothetical protein AAGJ50_01255 [Pseudomonadota bacterium]